MELRIDAQEMDVWVGATPGTTFACPTCGRASPIYDHEERRCRQLDTCQSRMLLYARIPRVLWDEARGIMTRAVRRGIQRRQPTVVPHLGMDEKSFLQRHQYVSVVVDLDTPRILHVANDRRATSLTRYFTELTDAQREGIAAMTMDMLEPSRHTLRAQGPDADAKIVFDTFHVVQHVGAAVDHVRKQEPWSSSRDSVPQPRRLR